MAAIKADGPPLWRLAREPYLAGLRRLRAGRAGEAGEHSRPAAVALDHRIVQQHSKQLDGAAGGSGAAAPGHGVFPAMPPSAYDLDDVRTTNVADLISSRNAAAISEMSLMSAADRHDLFVRQNFEDGLTLPDDYYDDLEDDEGSIIL